MRKLSFDSTRYVKIFINFSSCSILKENADEAVNSLDFAKRAKMIKKKVTKNVVLSAAELEYLAAQLKEEILILRGQVINAGLKYNF